MGEKTQQKTCMHTSLLCAVADTMLSNIQYIALYPKRATGWSWSCVNVVTQRHRTLLICKDLNTQAPRLYSNFC